jgi:hypothetical protein
MGALPYVQVALSCLPRRNPIAAEGMSRQETMTKPADSNRQGRIGIGMQSFAHKAKALVARMRVIDREFIDQRAVRSRQCTVGVLAQHCSDGLSERVVGYQIIVEKKS